MKNPAASPGMRRGAEVQGWVPKGVKHWENTTATGRTNAFVIGGLTKL